MQSYCDPTGFPLLRVREPAIDVQLFPVTKVQLERFLAEPNDFGDSWYEALLAAAPRVSYHRFGDEDREQVFATGILPEEAFRFASWMGPDFDLPTVEEWRAIHRALAREILTPVKLGDLRSYVGPGAAKVVLERLLNQLRPGSLLDLSLMRGGVVEWARQDKTWVGIGSPRPLLFPNLWDPLVDVVRPISPGERLPYFGFRLVRRLGDELSSLRSPTQGVEG